MFTQRQIALGGFLGVYAGCMALTANFMRLGYRRGAFVGVGFGTLTHLLVAWVYFALSAYISQWQDDVLWREWTTVAWMAGCALIIQGLSSAGCVLMGRYFMAPARSGDAFDRAGLLARLKSRDTGKRSVVHDVVQILERDAGLPARRFSTGWIVGFGVLSAMAHAAWLALLTQASLEVIFWGIEMDARWVGRLALRFAVPFAVLVLAQLSALAVFGCRDGKTE